MPVLRFVDLLRRCSRLGTAVTVLVQKGITVLQEMKTKKNRPKDCQLQSSKSITKAYLGVNSVDKSGFIDKMLVLQLEFCICSLLKCLREP